MRIPRIFILVATFVVLSKTFSTDEEAFESFKREFKKVYKNEEEEIYRRELYFKCRELIKEHNERYAIGLETFVLKENKFCDLNKDELAQFSTGNITPLFGKATGIINPGDLPPGPPSVDWSTSTNCITRVKDQGYHCDSCWAFSGIAALEAHWCIYRNESVSLSEQQLIDCNRHPRYGNFGCAPGIQSSAYYYIMNNGIESDATYPYDELVEHEDPFPCRYNVSRKVATTTGYYRMRPFNEDVLKDVIANLGPVSAAIGGSINSFFYYFQGIYDDPECPNNTAHSVLLVGYGTEDGVDYWILKNSWSSEWGENGYMKLRRGVDRCGITKYLIFPDVD